MVDCYLPGPSTPAEGVPALRASAATRCYLPGPSTPAEGAPALRAYGPQDATFRGLRPRQRVYQPFGPLRPQDCYFPGPSTPAEGVPALRAYKLQVCYLPGPSTPAEGVPALRASAATRCYLPGPSPPAEGVPALRAYEPQDCYLPGPSTPAEGVPGPRAYDMWGEFGGRESDRHATLRITDFQNGSGTVAFANSSSSKRNSCLATRLNSMCLPRTSPSQAQPPEL
jgi:hypothetical protein